MSYLLTHYRGFNSAWNGDECEVTLGIEGLRIQHAENHKGQDFPWIADLPHAALRNILLRSPERELANWDQSAVGDWGNGVLLLEVQLEGQETPRTLLLSGPMPDLRNVMTEFMLLEVGLERVDYVTAG